ncbi:hypothetical protein D0Z07_6667 [Hyphodiscus hymeniophilus]|uniref:DUF7779 domain-containing protein n=1 Tax=Hyphodiscus hymeniophilus TaxID=353542 RepID=A0A9P6VGM2_9HELO|nr:hypothetical protein D0Z07_6667 [Hyphodiscus hymeniophilus]
MRNFSTLLTPFTINYDLLWGLFYLNLKHSYASPDRLKRTTELLLRIQRVVGLFNRCIAVCEEENESRIAMVDFLDPITVILADSIAYLRDCSIHNESDRAWPDLNQSINEYLSTLDQTVRHVNDITSLSKVNQDRQIQNMSLRHALIPEPEEPGTFPNIILPFQENPRFYGRKKELQDIFDYLSPKGDQSLRTYTIFGRRGVGKTEIALQFAHTNPCAYDALFWIKCETSVGIRQSFTDVAVSLNLPGADSDGHHEENLIAVHSWLKRTKNAQVLKAYWPVGASGAILITSRKYHNFAKDLSRKGQTIRPFDPKQSWDLLLQLLGDDWKKLDQEGHIPQTEITAAKNLLGRLEGLALAIQQAAQLIKSPDLGGHNIVKTYELFKERVRTLPERHQSERSSSELALDALWDMIFNSLSRNARLLLGVLAWLSPDSIQNQLFLPRNQNALDGSLAFCKQDAKDVDGKNRASLASIITPSLAYEKASKELLDRELIKQDGPRFFSIHRVVQEATNFQNIDELQDSFDTATRLVFEQFPDRKEEESLFNRWNICQDYIPHGVFLSRKFTDYSASGKLKGSGTLAKLLSNCAWHVSSRSQICCQPANYTRYLLELGDYDVGGRVIETAAVACDDKRSIMYAEIRNTAGARLLDLNRLSQCRLAFEESKRIRTEHLTHLHPLMASINHNLGNLELALGNTEDSLDYYNQAAEGWLHNGDPSARGLALTYLCMGRVYMLQMDLDEALKLTALSEALFIRTIGRDKGFMSNVHYAYGNIHYRRDELRLAWADYNQCLKICMQGMSIHPLAAAAYYSLGCTEDWMGHRESAKGFLDKARVISELRSPNRDDGPIARNLWKTAEVLEKYPLNPYRGEAAALRARAEVAQGKLLAEGEGGVISAVQEKSARSAEEHSYDVLVPLFYR